MAMRSAKRMQVVGGERDAIHRLMAKGREHALLVIHSTLRFIVSSTCGRPWGIHFSSGSVHGCDLLGRTAPHGLLDDVTGSVHSRFLAEGAEQEQGTGYSGGRSRAKYRTFKHLRSTVWQGMSKLVQVPLAWGPIQGIEGFDMLDISRKALNDS